MSTSVYYMLFHRLYYHLCLFFPFYSLCLLCGGVPFHVLVVPISNISVACLGGNGRGLWQRPGRDPPERPNPTLCLSPHTRYKLAFISCLWMP
jgi:hypothetical protein